MRPMIGALLVAACGFEEGTFTPVRDDAPISADDAPVDVPSETAPVDMGSPPDSPASACITAICILAGGTCVMGACEIDEDSQGSVTCPSGMPCKVVCDTQDACKAGVDCGGATSCEVSCVGTATCQNSGVDCGQAQTCSVRCEGSSSCQHGDPPDVAVECRDALCEVTCTGSSSCQDGIDVDSAGTCASHCCNGGCEDGFDDCVNDNVCT